MNRRTRTFLVTRRVKFTMRITADDIDDAEDLASQVPLSEWFVRDDDMDLEQTGEVLE